MSERMNLQRLLVVKLADIGDLLTATPALRALRETWPSARIDLLTTPHAAAVAPRSWLDTIWATPRNFLTEPDDLAPLLRLTGALRSRDYDAVLFLHHLTLRAGVLKYRLLAALTRAPILAGLDNGQGRWLSHAAPDHGFGASHEVEYWLQVARLLGAETQDTRLAVQIDPAAQARAASLLAGQTAPLIAIHPGSGGYSPARRWEAGKWAAVADELARRRDARILLVGTAHDGAEAVGAAMQTPVLNLAGQTTLPELAALLGRCQLFLGADSGVMHLAAAAGAPLVALFGPSNHDAWRPWTPDGRFVVVRLGLACSPCSYTGHSVGQRDGCWHRSCLADLQPEQVIVAAEDVMRNA